MVPVSVGRGLRDLAAVSTAWRVQECSLCPAPKRERSLSTRLPKKALLQAIAERQPPPGLVHHSDRGVQYASAEYVDVLHEHQPHFATMATVRPVVFSEREVVPNFPVSLKGRTPESDSELVEEAFEAGAMAYVVKHDMATELIPAVHAGGTAGASSLAHAASARPRQIVTMRP